jgi:hypothetical protein
MKQAFSQPKTKKLQKVIKTLKQGYNKVTTKSQQSRSKVAAKSQQSRSKVAAKSQQSRNKVATKSQQSRNKITRYRQQKETEIYVLCNRACRIIFSFTMFHVLCIYLNLLQPLISFNIYLRSEEAGNSWSLKIFVVWFVPVKKCFVVVIVIVHQNRCKERL